MTVRGVSEALADLGRIHDERGQVYGDDYLHVGKVLSGMFPRGLHLRSSVDFNRFALLLYQVTKMGRYAQCLVRGEGHRDSLDDVSVYAQLLQHFDSLIEEATAAVREKVEAEGPRAGEGEEVAQEAVKGNGQAPGKGVLWPVPRPALTPSTDIENLLKRDWEPQA